MKILIYMLMVCFNNWMQYWKKDNQTKSPSKNVSMKNVNYTNKSNKPNEKAADHLASLAASARCE